VPPDEHMRSRTKRPGGVRCEEQQRQCAAQYDCDPHSTRVGDAVSAVRS
jgi:hypothetical protein